MQIDIIRNPNALYQKENFDALREGLEKYNIKSRFIENTLFCNSDIVACWGWRTGKVLREKGKDVIVLERGYVDRNIYTSICLNGLNGFGNFGDIKEDDKFFRVFKDRLKNWKDTKDKKYALIIGQTPNDMSLRGKCLLNWYEEKAIQIKEMGYIPLFRQHPNLTKKNIKQNIKNAHCVTSSDLLVDLEKCAFAITFNSNSAIDCLLQGYTVIIEDKGSIAYNYTINNLEDLTFEEPINREELFKKIAHMQWNLKEIKSGVALDNILKILRGKEND